MRSFRSFFAAFALALGLALGSCDVGDIVGDCEVVTDHFSSSYGPAEQKSHAFRLGCAGTINIFWSCPLCPDPDAGLLVLLDPLGTQVFDIEGAGFSGARRQVQTILEGQWTILVRGTGGNFINNYAIDVTYPGL